MLPNLALMKTDITIGPCERVLTVPVSGRLRVGFLGPG